MIHFPRYRKVGPAVQHTDRPLPKSATLGLHPVARKLLLISRPMKGRRLSWPEHTMGWQLAQGCLQMAPSEIRTQTESYKSNNLTTRPLPPIKWNWVLPGGEWPPTSPLLFRLQLTRFLCWFIFKQHIFMLTQCSAIDPIALTRKPSWRKGCARQQCVYTAILDFWNFKVAPLVRPSPKTPP